MGLGHTIQGCLLAIFFFLNLFRFFISRAFLILYILGNWNETIISFVLFCFFFKLSMSLINY